MAVFCNCMLLLNLIIMSIQDIKDKMISAIYLGAVFVVAVSKLIFTIGMGTINVWGIIFGIMPGLLLLGVCMVVKGAIGLSDCLTIIMEGMILELKELVIALGVTYILMTVVSLWLLTVRKVNGKTKIPMMPYITIGATVGIINVWM